MITNTQLAADDNKLFELMRKNGQGYQYNREHWTRNSDDCFKLALKFDIQHRIIGGSSVEATAWGAPYITTYAKDYEADLLGASRHAVVLVAIALLEKDFTKQLDDLDFQLAKVLGLNPIQYTSPEVGKRFDGVFIGQKLGAYPALNRQGTLFNPSRNWTILAPLMVQHGIFPEADYAFGGVSGVTTHYNGKSFSEHYQDPRWNDEQGKVDKETPVRVAVIRGIIEKLVSQT